MNNPQPFLKTCLAVTLALFFVVTGSGCSPSQQEAANTPIIQTVEIAQVVTLLVTQDITQEVTRVIEVPVTVTPPATPDFTFTPALNPTNPGTLTITSAPELPVISILEYSDCLYGPGSLYLYKTSIAAGSQMEAVGRSQDGSWINVQEIHGWNACWIPVSQTNLNNIGVNNLPFIYTALPITRFEYSSPTAKARRNGTEVTVSWQAIWMSLDEVRGYLIEAWVCQGGQLIFLPVHVSTTYEENVSTFTVTITDETGCVEPSSAHISSAGKRGYTPWEKIFWPPH